MHFQNFARIDDELIYKEALEKLQKHSSIILADEKLLPYSNEVEGEHDGQSFTLVLDLDYGAFVHSGHEECLDKLETILTA